MKKKTNFCMNLKSHVIISITLQSYDENRPIPNN